MTRFDKYLKVVDWAKARYVNEHGLVTIHKGGVLAPYGKIEQAAAIKYLRITKF